MIKTLKKITFLIIYIGLVLPSKLVVTTLILVGFILAETIPIVYRWSLNLDGPGYGTGFKKIIDDIWDEEIDYIKEMRRK